MSYSPTTARWSTAEPSGGVPYVDGPNLYQELEDNPISRLDPTGLQATTQGTSTITASFLAGHEPKGPWAWDYQIQYDYGQQFAGKIWYQDVYNIVVAMDASMKPLYVYAGHVEDTGILNAKGITIDQLNNSNKVASSVYDSAKTLGKSPCQLMYLSIRKAEVFDTIDVQDKHTGAWNVYAPDPRKGNIGMGTMVENIYTVDPARIPDNWLRHDPSEWIKAATPDSGNDVNMGLFGGVRLNGNPLSTILSLDYRLVTVDASGTPKTIGANTTRIDVQGPRLTDRKTISEGTGILNT